MNKIALVTIATITSVLLTGCISPRTEELVSQCADLRTDAQKEDFLSTAKDRLAYIDANGSTIRSIVLRIRDPGVWTHVGPLRQCVLNVSE